MFCELYTSPNFIMVYIVHFSLFSSTSGVVDFFGSPSVTWQLMSSLTCLCLKASQVSSARHRCAHSKTELAKKLSLTLAFNGSEMK